MKKLLMSFVLGFSLMASASVHAWGLGGLGGVLSSAIGMGGGESAGDITANARNTLLSFAKAQLGLADALGGYEQLAANRALLDNLEKGDAAASKSELETIVSISKSATQEINLKVEQNSQLDAEQKSKAKKAMLEYVKGLYSSRNLIKSVKGVANNPTSLMTNADSILYLVRELPNIVSGAIASTSTLYDYMASKGVDVSDAKASAADLGT
jgi:hypothetical protein